MKRLALVLAVFLLGLGFGAAGAAEVRWHKTLEEALAAGDQGRRPVGVVFLDEGNFSERLEAVLEEAGVQEFLGKIEPVRLTFGDEANKGVADGYGVQKAPTIVLLNPEGKLLGMVGYRKAEFLILTMEEILKRQPREDPPAPSARKRPQGPGSPGADAQDGEQNPIRPVVGLMEDVRGDLDREDTGPVVQQKIKGILDELDRLIELADQQQGGGGNQSDSQQSEGKKDQGEGKQGEEENQKSSPGQGGSPTKGSASMKAKEGAKNSTAATKSGATRINNPFSSPASPWGSRLKNEGETSAVLKPREGVAPPEYDAYVKEYTERLGKASQER